MCGTTLKGEAASLKAVARTHDSSHQNHSGNIREVRHICQVTPLMTSAGFWPVSHWGLGTVGSKFPHSGDFTDIYQSLPFFNSDLYLLRLFLRNVNDRLFRLELICLK